MARQLAEERQTIRGAAQAEAAEAHQLSLAQRDQTIQGMKRTIEELRKKADQGSQQSQGEALEVTLEDMLRQAFPQDEIEPVPKGITGADLVHRVKSDAGVVCGTILWEAKRTKHWTAGWLPKLRDDQRALKAELAALVSIALPADAPPISNQDGVWVTGFASAIGLAQVLRMSLRRSSAAKRALEGRQDKMDLLYAYFTGPEFRSRVEGLLEPFLAMKEDLEKERRSVQRLWAKREKQIERALTSTSGLYGDVQGIAGGAIPELSALDLPALEDGDDG